MDGGGVGGGGEQEAAMDVSKLEPELKAKVKALCPTETTVYFNKGL